MSGKGAQDGDASMGGAEDGRGGGGGGSSSGGSSGGSSGSSGREDGSSSSSGSSFGSASSPQRVIPTVFRWEHGGDAVFITGTFNGWGPKIPMHRSGNDFIYIQSLTAQVHKYKFVVNDEWRFAPDQPIVKDAEGNVNNVMDLSTFHSEEEVEEECVPWTTGTAAAAVLKRRDSLDGAAYGHVMPDEESYSKEPPLLPPHLRQIILNQPSPDPGGDPMLLPTPMHVTLNHLYCTTIRDGLMVQAITQRYRRKFVSTVYYTMEQTAASRAPLAAAR